MHAIAAVMWKFRAVPSCYIVMAHAFATVPACFLVSIIVRSHAITKAFDYSERTRLTLAIFTMCVRLKVFRSNAFVSDKLCELPDCYHVFVVSLASRFTVLTPNPTVRVTLSNVHC